MRIVTVIASFGLLLGCQQQIGQPVSPSGDVATFEDCLIAGGVINESYPTVCNMNSHDFTQDIRVGKTGDKKVLRFLVAPQTATCQGFLPVEQRCLIVNGENFFDSIEGYSHKEGVGKIMTVERTQICNPNILNSCPADIGIYRYKLIEIEA